MSRRSTAVLVLAIGTAALVTPSSDHRPAAPRPQALLAPLEAAPLTPGGSDPDARGVPSTAPAAPSAQPSPVAVPTPASREKPLVLDTPSPSAAAQTGDPRAYARTRLSESQFACLDALWTVESRWDSEAYNSSSGAYGIPQFLPSTWAGIGVVRTSDPIAQVDAGEIYIKGRYGDECSAWAHSQATGWY